MADDLRHFLDNAASPAVSSNNIVPGLLSPGSAQEATPQPATTSTWDSKQRSIKIVPKGLRSFGERDADFFLGLVPGPRDRDRLPESIRFWKKRIDSTDSGKTFRVGLIYGPSGCGKSSLVKAGFCPDWRSTSYRYTSRQPRKRRKPTAEGLRKVCPELPPDGIWSIPWREFVWDDASPGHKVLLVLDQFEQWLHAKRGEENTELVAAFGNATVSMSRLL